MNRKRKIALTIVIASIIAISFILVETFSLQDYTLKGIPEYFPPNSMENPNLRIASPYPKDNQIDWYPGYLEINPSISEASLWGIAQWKSADPLRVLNSTELFGNFSVPDYFKGFEPVYYQSKSDSSLMILFGADGDGDGHYHYVLHSHGGIYTPGGGKNLFITCEPLKPIPLARSEIGERVDPEYRLMVGVDVRIIDMYANGAPPDNVAQIFLGFIFSGGTITNNSVVFNETLFVQGILSNTHGVKEHIALDPGTGCGLYSQLAAKNLLEPDPNTTHSINMDLTQYVIDAIEYKYVNPLEEKGGEYITYFHRSLSEWYLTGIYLGLETQGDAGATIALSNFNLYNATI